MDNTTEKRGNAGELITLLLSSAQLRQDFETNRSTVLDRFEITEQERADLLLLELSELLDRVPGSRLPFTTHPTALV
jgi:hypothetical protein